jgi:penicillin-insensitive murein DD-endopeptidase
MRGLRCSICLLLLWPLAAFSTEESTCYGTSDNGRLASGWQLPVSGNNFSAYNSVGVLAGRTYVHSKVYRTVVDAYAILEKQAPSKTFVYGESGFRDGGKFKPHKTHQNGLSVDFFVPVVNSSGQYVPLPTSVFNKLGYDIEFVGSGQYNELTIDYAAMAQHLLALQQAADKNGVKIWRVIFDNAFQKELFNIPEAALLRNRMTFSTKTPWVRHDEHYHIDFTVSCEAIR